MHLRGHDSNHDRPLGMVLEWVPEASSIRPRRPAAAVLGAKRLDNGAVRRAAIGALSAADRALTVAEVQVAVEARLGQRVSEYSVRSCLSAGARGAEPRFRLSAVSAIRSRLSRSTAAFRLVREGLRRGGLVARL